MNAEEYPARSVPQGPLAKGISSVLIIDSTAARSELKVNKRWPTTPIETHNTSYQKAMLEQQSTTRKG